MKSCILWMVAMSLALTAMLSPVNARAQDSSVRVSAEGFGGLGTYYESCCDGVGFSVGGALGLGTPMEDNDISIGGRLQFIYTQTDVSILGFGSDFKAVNLTVGPVVEFGTPGIFTGYGYLGVGYSHLSASLLGLGASGDGFLVALGVGGRAYFNDNVFFLFGLDLARGYADVDALHFTLNGGIGAAFE